MSDSEKNPPIVRDHRRQWRDCLYVYPVISRRARGLSIGVNLNIDKACNYSCLYCQIDRRQRRPHHAVDVEVLRRELELALREADSGRLWEDPRFAETPPEMRQINDIAFSGDGEPTCLANFDEAVAAAVAAKQAAGREDVKLVVITNATKLDSPQVRRALLLLDANGGEFWAKLDAGTEKMFRAINQPRGGLTLRTIVDNITAIAKQRPVVVQSLFVRLDGRPPATEEIAAYCEHLGEILGAGGAIKLVQVHTIARSPASSRVQRLEDHMLDKVTEVIRTAVAPVPVETYYGSDVPPQENLPAN